MANEQTTQAGSLGLSKGSKVGKYEIVERLGMGGQAVIYKARDALLDRFVAIKQINASLAGDEKFVDRFRKEAQILARLGNEQESIVTIHELIEDDQGLFIVMEYLAGNSLEKIITDTNGPAEPKATLQIMWRLAAALHAVHAAGIIHRDLKPSNIIVGQGLRAKITDFGVAASLSGQTSMLLGTTKYMAPELFEGERIDGRADEYSLGFIAYEMLTGRPKFNEIFSDIVRDKHSEALRWMKWHGNTAVHAPELVEVNPAVPPALSLIVAKMMQKDQEKRFSNMEQLGRAIKMAFSPRAKGGVRKPARRRVAAAAAVGAPVRAGLTAEDSGAPLVPRDEGDELELAPEGAATAPIPSAKVGRKLLLFLMPVVILGVVSLAGWAIYRVVQRNIAHELTKETAGKAYTVAAADMKEALRSYEKKRFEEASKNYAKVIERYPSSTEARMARVMRPIAEAYLATAEERWEDALAREDEASQRIKEIQTSVSSDDPMHKWALESRDYVRNHRSYYTATRTFNEAMIRAKAEFENHQYDEVRLIFQQVRRDVTPTTGQQAQIEEFLKKVDLTEFREKLQAAMQKADDLLAEDKFTEAQEAYEAVREILAGDDASILPPADSKAAEKKITGQLALIASKQTLQGALSAVEKARAAGDKRMLIIALRALDRIRPDEKTKAEVLKLQSEVALDKGREFKAAGNIPKAREQFREALKYDPENKDAKAEIELLDRADEHAALVSAGDSKFAQAQWAEAVAEYAKAGKIKMDDSLTAKIKECRFRIALGNADQLRMAGKYAEAAAAYEEARREKPTAAALIDARLAAMRADATYQKLMEQGRAALKIEQWAKARDYFTQAQKIRSTAEVKEAILETRYRENMAQGDQSMEQSDYNGALGYYKLAKGFKDTQEIRDKIKQAEQKAKG